MMVVIMMALISPCNMLQALVLYAHQIIWESFEGERLKFCAHRMTLPELDDERRKDRVERLTRCYSRFKSTTSAMPTSSWR